MNCNSWGSLIDLNLLVVVFRLDRGDRCHSILVLHDCLFFPHAIDLVDLHYDNSDNLLHVVSGKKNIILFPPSETKLLYKKVMKKHNGKMLFNDF